MASKYPTRKIGNDQVSAIGFGAMGMSAFYAGKHDSDEENFRVLDRLVAEGCNFIDTARIYGDSEAMIGRWFKKSGHRKDVFLATKFGIEMGPNSPPIVKSDPAYVKESCNRSLGLLGISTIDLFYQHRVDPNTPIEETIGALKDLIDEGKIRYIGLSECSADTLRRAHKVHPIAAVQLEYSPFSLDIESPQINLLKTCRELGVTIVCYSPLGRGFLTGQIKSRKDFGDGDFRATLPRFSDENFDKNLELVHKIADIGKQINATPGQTTLAWILAQGPDFIPIPGTKEEKYLLENIAAAHITLSAQQIKAIRDACESFTTAGERYPAAMISTLYADSKPLSK